MQICRVFYFHNDGHTKNYLQSCFVLPADLCIFQINSICAMLRSKFFALNLDGQKLVQYCKKVLNKYLNSYCGSEYSIICQLLHVSKSFTIWKICTCPFYTQITFCSCLMRLDKSRFMQSRNDKILARNAYVSYK